MRPCAVVHPGQRAGCCRDGRPGAGREPAVGTHTMFDRVQSPMSSVTWRINAESAVFPGLRHPHRDPVAGHSHPDHDLREIVAGVLGHCRRRETPRCSRRSFGGLDEARHVPCGERYVCGWWKQPTGAHLRVLLLRTNQRGSATGSWTRSLSRWCSAISPSRIEVPQQHLRSHRQLQRAGNPGPGELGGSVARGGVGGIISAHVPVDVHGRILPNYAHIDDDRMDVPGLARAADPTSARTQTRRAH
jgi:hypothetical protein